MRRSVCTSETLRASTRVSSGFTLLGHSSPSFGSQQERSQLETGRSVDRKARSMRCANGQSRPALAPTVLGTVCSHFARSQRLGLSFEVAGANFQTPPPHLHPSDSRTSCTPWSVFQDGRMRPPVAPATAARGVVNLPDGQTQLDQTLSSSPSPAGPLDQKRPGHSHKGKGPHCCAKRCALLDRLHVHRP